MKVMCEAKEKSTQARLADTIADFNGNISLKNISPRREGEIKNLSQQREEISRASDGGANVVPSSTNSDSYVGGAPVSAGRSSDGVNIAQEVQNVNDENDHTTTRKAPVSPGELIEPGYNGEVSIKSAYKKPLANSLADVERNVVSGESAQITPNEDARLAPNNRSIEVADRQLADNFTGATTNYSVANNSRNVNEDVKYKLNPEHEAQVRAYNEHITRLRQREEYLRGQGMSENAPAMINLRKAQEQAIYARDHIGEVDKLGNVLAYDISGIRKSTGRGLDGSAISADALDQSIDNSSIPNNPQNVNTDNHYKHPLQETINEMEANPKPKMTRELREAIDEFIYENIDHNLFNNAIVLELFVEMAGNHTLLEEELAHTTVE